MGSAPECGDDELAYQTENEENIKDIVVTEISGKMSSNPSYDCDLQSSAQMKFGFYDEDGGFKFVDMNMSKSEEQFVKQAAEEWSEKLKSVRISIEMIIFRPSSNRNPKRAQQSSAARTPSGIMKENPPNAYLVVSLPEVVTWHPMS
ncbi:hypothetical protein ANCCAN_26290 [Ancylostoma caninum]|uniref:Uncharacterized protein n=1 Tax=Ancylostoma caninum TaxID=29170 RepID=A0A368F750_ANCCA|nr:hypothetical protein ANCCAN_26290 [Ancylostoma caninum]